MAKSKQVPKTSVPPDTIGMTARTLALAFAPLTAYLATTTPSDVLWYVTVGLLWIAAGAKAPFVGKLNR